MFCPECDQKILTEDIERCPSCGTSLHPRANETTLTLTMPIDAEEEEIEIAEVSDREPLFVVKKGPFAGQKFKLKIGEVTLGRDPGSDIFLDDITVSRRHAKVVIADDDVVVTDVGSLNGTYVNKERIEKAWLNPGDELQVGKFKLVFLRGNS